MSRLINYKMNWRWSNKRSSRTGWISRGWCLSQNTFRYNKNNMKGMYHSTHQYQYAHMQVFLLYSSRCKLKAQLEQVNDTLCHPYPLSFTRQSGSVSRHLSQPRLCSTPKTKLWYLWRISLTFSCFIIHGTSWSCHTVRHMFIIIILL